MDAERRWQRHGIQIVVLGILFALSTVLLPWFNRTTLLPAGDGHSEWLIAWMSGDAVAPAGSGPFGFLRVVPWGLLMVLAAIAGAAGGLAARRRPITDPIARRALRISGGSAVAGLVFVGLAWLAAAAGVDTDTVPMFGMFVGILVLLGWLALAVTMLRIADHQRQR